MSNARRNEIQILFDIIGFESLLDENNSLLATGVPHAPTSTAPMPQLARWVRVLCIPHPRVTTYICGTVTDFLTGNVIEGVELSV